MSTKKDVLVKKMFTNGLNMFATISLNKKDSPSSGNTLAFFVTKQFQVQWSEKNIMLTVF